MIEGSFFINDVDWTIPDRRRVINPYTHQLHPAMITVPEKPTVTIEQLRHALKQWVEKDESRHPDFQDKELIQESKELINKSRI